MRSNASTRNPAATSGQPRECAISVVGCAMSMSGGSSRMPPSPRALSDIEERELWREVIDSSEVGRDMLEPGGAARAARRARRATLRARDSAARRRRAGLGFRGVAGVSRLERRIRQPAAGCWIASARDELLALAPPPARAPCMDRESGVAAHGAPMAAAPWPDAASAGVSFAGGMPAGHAPRRRPSWPRIAEWARRTCAPRPALSRLDLHA